jgi:hypothetical protein
MADSALVFAQELNQFGDWLIAIARVCHSTSIDVLLTYTISQPVIHRLSVPVVPLIARHRPRRLGDPVEAEDLVLTHTPSVTTFILLVLDHRPCNPATTAEFLSPVRPQHLFLRSRPSSMSDEAGRGRGPSPSGACEYS